LQARSDSFSSAATVLDARQASVSITPMQTPHRFRNFILESPQFIAGGKNRTRRFPRDFQPARRLVARSFASSANTNPGGVLA
jgi:hypothetical protein